MSEYDMLAGAFVEEALDLLDQLQEDLLVLERTPDEVDSVDRVFRCLHTIKGSGAMFGFDDIATLAHEVENAYQSVRAGKLDVTSALIDSTLRAADAIRQMIGAISAGESEFEAMAAGVRSEFTEGAAVGFGTHAQAPAQGAGEDPNASSVPGANRRFRIDLALPPAALAAGTDPLEILDQLRRLGDCTVAANAEDLPAVDRMDPGECYLRWTAVIAGAITPDDISDILLFAGDADVTIDEIEAEAADHGQDRTATDQPMPAYAVASKPMARAGVQAASLRVTPAKLDELVNLVGELVTAQARLSEVSEQMIDPRLAAVAEDIERLTGSLRDNVLDIRMVPIGSMFGKFARLVRDLSASLGKDAELIVEGGDTELDKTVIDRISEPLVHLVRNAIDHGIESPDERRAAGKRPAGVVRLSAYQSGGEVVIEVADDGAGLDFSRIRQMAVERGVLADDTELDDAQVADLLFAAGFSTATEVTSVSGRGVGLDVVKQTVDDLRGTVHIEAGRDGGSVTRIKLPLTLAIIEGLLVEVADDRYVVPLDVVDECIDLQEHRAAADGRVVNLRGKPVPYVRLREVFSLSPERPEREIAVIVRIGEDRIGFAVDDVIGQHQTVIKSLGRMHRGVPGVSGATILGDGSVALILDVTRLARVVEARRASAGGRGC